MMKKLAVSLALGIPLSLLAQDSIPTLPPEYTYKEIRQRYLMDGDVPKFSELIGKWTLIAISSLQTARDSTDEQFTAYQPKGLRSVTAAELKFIRFLTKNGKNIVEKFGDDNQINRADLSQEITILSHEFLFHENIVVPTPEGSVQFRLSYNCSVTRVNEIICGVTLRSPVGEKFRFQVYTKDKS